MIVSLAQKSDAESIADIHKEEIKKGFLASLKISFLSTFYEALIGSKHSFCLVAKEGEMVVGFVSGVLDISKFYQYFFKHYFFISARILFPKILNISFIKKATESVLYPKKTKNLPPAELLTIAVKKEFQGRGLGKELLQKCVAEFKARNITTFKVLVGKNLPSVSFYRKNGFNEVGQINLHGNDPSIVFTYKL